MGFFDSTTFDANKVAPSAPFTPLPEGVYRLAVKSSTEDKTKDGTGLMLKVELAVVEPANLKGRSLFHRITLRNKNPQATEIGQAQLSAFCRATGVMVPKSAGQFVGKLLRAKIKVEKRQDNGELSNRLAEILLPEAPPQAPAGAAAPTPPPADEGAPWGT